MERSNITTLLFTETLLHLNRLIWHGIMFLMKIIKKNFLPKWMKIKLGLGYWLYFRVFLLIHGTISIPETSIIFPLTSIYVSNHSTEHFPSIHCSSYRPPQPYVSMLAKKSPILRSLQPYPLQFTYLASMATIIKRNKKP